MSINICSTCYKECAYAPKNRGRMHKILVFLNYLVSKKGELFYSVKVGFKCIDPTLNDPPDKLHLHYNKKIANISRMIIFF